MDIVGNDFPEIEEEPIIPASIKNLFPCKRNSNTSQSEYKGIAVNLFLYEGWGLSHGNYFSAHI